MPIKQFISFGKRFTPLLAWAPVAGTVVAWTAYPALTDSFKHKVAPFIFPDPEAK